MESTPPPIPESIWPNDILFAIFIIVSKPVPQARCISTPGVFKDRPESMTHSLARFQSLECFMTAPSATSPKTLSCRLYLSTIALSEAVIIF